MIEGFMAKLAEEATSITEIPNDEVQQASDIVGEMMDEDEGRRQLWTALCGCVLAHLWAFFK